MWSFHALKTCSQCTAEKELSAFGVRKASRDGLNARCKPCLNSDPKIKAYGRKYAAAHPERMRQRSREHYARNPAKRQAATKRWREKNAVSCRYGKLSVRLRKAFGIDVEDWARMFNAQDQKCAICLEKLDGGFFTHVDHCHATGKVRGILCTFCNSMLGYARDSRSHLLAGIHYLEAHSAPSSSP